MYPLDEGNPPSGERKKGASEVQNNLMTSSVDLGMLMQQPINVTGSGNSTDAVPGLIPQESWAISGPHRPNSLFEYDAKNRTTLLKTDNQQQQRHHQQQHKHWQQH